MRIAIQVPAACKSNARFAYKSGVRVACKSGVCFACDVVSALETQGFAKNKNSAAKPPPDLQAGAANPTRELLSWIPCVAGHS